MVLWPAGATPCGSNPEDHDAVVDDFVWVSTPQEQRAIPAGDHEGQPQTADCAAPPCTATMHEPGGCLHVSWQAVEHQ